MSTRAHLTVLVSASALLAACGGGGRGRDFDRDGIADAYDLCPEAAEDFNGVSDTDGCPDVVCLANQIFDVRWEVDVGDRRPLRCSDPRTAGARVEVFTNANQVLPVNVDVECDDLEFYNWIGSTQSNIPVNTVIQGADLIGANGALLSTLDVPPAAQTPITPCTAVLYTFEFPIN